MKINPGPIRTTSLAFTLLALLSNSSAFAAAAILVDPHNAVTATMDGGTAKTGNTWYEVGVNPAAPTTGLPTGIFTSQADPLSTYEIQPATGMNAFLLDSSNTVGTVTFVTPVALQHISFAGSSGNGAGTVTPTLLFADGTSDTLTNLALGDWFNNTPSAYTTDGRLSLDAPNSFNTVGASGNNPRVLAVNWTNSAADAAKPIQGIHFTWKGASGTTHTCIFAVSGDTNGSGHFSPITLTANSYNQDMIVGVAEVSQNAYVQQNLVSDLTGKAGVTDTNLVNPWGLTAGPSTPFWVSDNGTGLSTVYDSTGAVQSLVVTIPAGAGVATPAHPTGIVFNGTTNFVVTAGTSNAPAKFIFATEEGTISGWATGSTAALTVDNSTAKAVYKGLTMAALGTNEMLYAANFRAGSIDVFDSNFKPLTNSPPLTTNGVPFADTNLPAGFAPFNIRAFGTNLFVTYALVSTNDPTEDEPGAGNGIVDVYDPSGKLLKRFASNGALNAPWGLAQAPASWGPFASTMLVGNFGDGKINAFDPGLGTYLGPVLGTNGQAIVNQGLWGLLVGNGGRGGDTNTLYFTAGIPGTGQVESHGLLGSISFQTNQTAGVPWELLQSVTAFQDDFTSKARNTNWVAVGPGGDLYVQTNGVLQVSVSAGDPNHLLYMGAGGSNNVQEVLARVRVAGFNTAAADAPRGGICVGSITNLPSGGGTNWSAFNIQFRNNADLAGPNYHFRQLDDLRNWGAQQNLVWTNSMWYWMRLRMDPKADGTNDYFGRVWPADGSTPEPVTWTMQYSGASAAATKVLHYGWAGITGASSGGMAQLEVDYVLIKSATLPAITANFAPLGPPVNLAHMSITAATNNVVVNWFGGNLQSAGTVAGPWTPMASTPSPYALKATGTNKFYRVSTLIP